MLTAAPKTGVWELDDRGRLIRALGQRLAQPASTRPRRFYLGVAAPGDYRYKGADLGILVTRGRMQTDDHQLTERCQQWLDGIKSQFAGTPVAPGESEGRMTPVAFKKS